MDLSLTRTEAAAAVEPLGWRYLLGAAHASVPATSLADAARIATVAAEACGPDADRHLRAGLRADRVELRLQDRDLISVTDRDVALARAVSAVLPTTPGPGERPVQALEIAVDALDIPAVRPFWRAVLGLTPEEGWLVDPAGELPTVWFQQMDAPRPQRNRIHFDITVGDQATAEARVAAALAAGGRLLDDSAARAFWVLADPEGNEVCVCTWLDRDAPSDTA